MAADWLSAFVPFGAEGSRQTGPRRVKRQLAPLSAGSLPHLLNGSSLPSAALFFFPLHLYTALTVSATEIDDLITNL